MKQTHYYFLVYGVFLIFKMTKRPFQDYIFEIQKDKIKIKKLKISFYYKVMI